MLAGRGLGEEDDGQDGDDDEDGDEVEVEPHFLPDAKTFELDVAGLSLKS